VIDTDLSVSLARARSSNIPWSNAIGGGVSSGHHLTAFASSAAFGFTAFASTRTRYTTLTVHPLGSRPGSPAV
jgi:hypothetical protein